MNELVPSLGDNVRFREMSFTQILGLAGALMKVVPWFLFAVFALICVPALSAERLTAEDLLGAYQKSVEPFTRVHAEWTEKRASRQVGEDRTIDEFHERTIFRDGSRWRVSDVNRQSHTSNGMRREFVARSDLIIAEQLVNVFLMDTRDGKQVPVEQGLQVSAWLDPRNAREAAAGARGAALDPGEMPWRAAGDAQILFGRFSGDAGQSIWKVMREASTLEVLPETEVLDGVETQVVKSRGKFGSHTLWLDSKCGCLPRRVEIIKKLGDLHDDYQFGSRIGQAEEPPRDPDKPPNQVPDLRESWSKIEVTRIENRDGLFVITAWNADGRIVRADGKTMGGPVEYSVSRVNVKPETWPDNPFRPSIEIPNRTRVLPRDGLPGMEYEWVEGTIQTRGVN
jgi:hypothetical protein